MFSKMPIKHKLNAIILLTTFVVLILTSLVYFFNQRQFFRQKTLEELQTLSRVISESSQAGLAFQDAKSLQKTLSSLVAKPSVVTGRVYTIGGDLLVEYRRGHVNKKWSDEGLSPELLSEEYLFFSDHLSVISPVVLDKEKIGHVFLQASLDELRRNMVVFTVFMASILGVGLVIAMFLATRLQRVITQPVMQLLEAVKKVSENKDYSLRVPVQGEDELGNLASGFNDMLLQIQERDEHLEEQVALRTEDFRKAKESAEKANRAKSVFLANMSHELRTPLNVILGFTQLLETDSNIVEKQLEEIRLISKSGKHLLGLINDVLQIAKIEAGRITLSEAPFDLPYFLFGIEEIYGNRTREKGLGFRREQETVIPAFIKSDERKLRQILVNLLANAVKFTGKGTITLHVRVESNKDDNKLTLHLGVEDTGPGIAVEDQEKIFEPFYQTEQSVSATDGTGLGLAICRQFVSLLGGSIHVESKIGKGAFFHVSLPVERVEDGDTSDKSGKSRKIVGIAPDGPVYRVLIVEDNQGNRILLSRLLKDVGFEVREAVDGSEGVKMFQAWQPDFVWMDMRMPVMDGYEATRKIKQTKKGTTTPVVALTAHAFEEERKEILAAGCDDFVGKPINIEEVLAVMQKYLGVRFLYEGNGESASAGETKVAPDPVAVFSFDGLDAALLQDLAAAALTLDGEACLTLIKRLDLADKELEKLLQGMVANFQFEKLHKRLVSENDE